MLKKIQSFYSETMKEVRELLQEQLKFWAYGFFSALFFFMVAGIAQLYPEEIAVMLASNYASLAGYLASIVAIFIPYFLVNLIVSSKGFWGKLGNSAGASLWLGTIAIMGFQFPLTMNSEFMPKTILGATGFVLGSVICFTFGLSVWDAMVGLASSPIKRSEKRKNEALQPLDEIKFHANAALSLADFKNEGEYKEALRLIAEIASVSKAEAEAT